MTWRQAGRRTAAVSPRRARGARTSRRREETFSPRERRRLLQLAVCCAVFVLLVAVKLLLPEKLALFDESLQDTLQRNMDLQAVFSAVGRAFSGEADVGGAAREVYQAVFHPADPPEALVGSDDGIPAVGSSAALGALRSYRTIRETEPEAGPSPDPADLAYVLYSEQNLPSNVSLEQSILDFRYCTPVQGTLTSGFGYRDHPTEGEERFHYGVDLGADRGTEIRCFADGTVTAVGDSSSYGKYCVVSHQGGCTTLYAHCSRISVSSGAAVSMGQKLGEVGDTGAATGAHLHFELQKDGLYLNPIYYVSAL